MPNLSEKTNRAVSVGLSEIHSGSGLSDAKVFRLILQPGFSTAGQVTAVSGRGVGLDVAERNINALRGPIEIRSQKGNGSVFTLELPLTLAIGDGLPVQAGESRFVLPVSEVLEWVELNGEQMRRANIRNAVVERDQMIPLISLRRHFAVPGVPSEIAHVILVKSGQGKFGLLVDLAIGDDRADIRSLGRIDRDVEGIPSAAIPGDGSLALIVDPGERVAGVMQSA